MILIPNPDFKVTVHLEVKYLKNGASYGHSYYITLIGSHRMVSLSMTLIDP